MSSYLVFALGPVQGFIAQSRRTADGWAGSYLISYLAARGLKAALDGGHVRRADVVEPALDGLDMWEALQDPAKRCLAARVAAVPNTLLLKTDTPNVLGGALKDAIAETWSNDIAEKVKTILQDVRVTVDSATWTAQTNRFWEYYWAWGDTSDKAYLALAARKGLRYFVPSEESGDRCTVCAQRAALTDTGKRARDTWTAWATFVNRAKWAATTLISPEGRERLCAVCLIKRVIPWAETDVRLWYAGDAAFDSANPAAFPSTSTMATVRYRADVIREARQHPTLMQAVQSLHHEAGKIKTDSGAPVLGLNSVRQDDFNSWKKLRPSDEEKPFLRSDGDLWLYSDAVRNEHGLTDSTHAEITAAYRAMLGAAREAGLRNPPIYYAVLTMDGDRMGKYIRAVNAVGIETTKVSHLLNGFAQEVPPLVEGFDGRLIFAGGDDVLALLPLETALDAADALRQRFAGHFATWHGEQTQAGYVIEADTCTLSGAIVYAHHQAPLGRVIAAGQHLLKEWAKKKAGRDAIALQRFQRGGPAETFARRWDVDASTSTPKLIADLASQLAQDKLSDRAFYQLRDFAWMLGGPMLGEKVSGHRPSARQSFIAAMARKSRLLAAQAIDEQDEAREAQAFAFAADVLRITDGAVSRDARTGELAVDPLLLIRFLASGGREDR